MRLASADPTVSPHIDDGFLSDPEGRDVETLVAGLAVARRFAETEALRRLARPVEMEDEERVRSTLAAIFHPVGTCAIGAVVDADLRVRGVENLYVGDASVMPSIPRANTHLSVLAIAEKLAATALGKAQCDYGVLFSRDGKLAASRGLRDRVQVVDVETGKRLWLGPATPERRAKAFSYPLFFSPDSSRLAYCVATRAAVSTIVADARTGAIRGRVRGTCAVAYTRRGVAAVRRGAVFLGTRRLFAPRRPARLAPGVGAAIAANPAGTRLAVAVRRSRQTLEPEVIDLAGKVRGRYRAGVRIPLSPLELAPGARSAVVWWGCIIQLAPFDRTHGTFGLL